MVTYDEILSRMTEEYTNKSGIVPSKTSDVYIRMSVLAGEIYNTAVNMDWLKRQMFPATAMGDYLDYHAAERGVERRGSSAAVGVVRFTLDIGAIIDVVIPKGTIVSTSGEEPLCFETTSSVTMKQGTYTADAPVKAISHGSKYNVAAGKISVVVTPVMNSMRVTNPETLESGADAESDESLRKRVVASYVNASNGTNCAYYEKIATETPGVTFAAAVPKGRGAGTVDVYVACAGSQVSQETLEQVQETLSVLREVNVDVLVKRAEPAVVNMSLDISVSEGYEFENVKNACVEALRTYIDTRGVGGSVLLTQAGERIYHIEGVKEYSFASLVNSDVRCAKTHYPVTGTISVTREVYV